MQNKKQMALFWCIELFLCIYFMQLFNIPNKLTILIGGLISIILLMQQKRIRIGLGTILLTLTMFSYFIISEGVQGITMTIPYVGVLIYVLADYLSCGITDEKEFEKLFFWFLVALITGYSIHGLLNSYLFLDGQLEPGNPRYWMDIWEQNYIPATWHVIFFLPVLASVFGAIVYIKKRKIISILVGLVALFFMYISIVSGSRTSIAIFALVFCAQVVLYVILEWHKVIQLLKDKKIRTIGLAMILIVVLFAFLLRNHEAVLSFKAMMGRSGGMFQNVRFRMQRRALEQLFLYPMGGRQMDFLGRNWAHNVWLDMANVSGLIPFFLFTGYTFLTIFELIKWLLKKDISVERKLLTAGIYISFFLYYTVERGFEGSIHYMTPWFFINGLVHGELKTKRGQNRVS